MKKFKYSLLLSGCLAIISLKQSDSQIVCHDIERMPAKITVYSTKKDKTVYAKILPDTTFYRGHTANRKWYVFFMKDSSCVYGKICRRWTPLAPLWNTGLLSDTILYNPVDYWIIVDKNREVTSIFTWHSSGYCGPRFR